MVTLDLADPREDRPVQAVAPRRLLIQAQIQGRNFPSASAETPSPSAPDGDTPAALSDAPPSAASAATSTNTTATSAGRGDRDPPRAARPAAASWRLPTPLSRLVPAQLAFAPRGHLACVAHHARLGRTARAIATSIGSRPAPPPARRRAPSARCATRACRARRLASASAARCRTSCPPCVARGAPAAAPPRRRSSWRSPSAPCAAPARGRSPGAPPAGRAGPAARTPRARTPPALPAPRSHGVRPPGAPARRRRQRRLGVQEAILLLATLRACAPRPFRAAPARPRAPRAALRSAPPARARSRPRRALRDAPVRPPAACRRAPARWRAPAQDAPVARAWPPGAAGSPGRPARCALASRCSPSSVRLTCSSIPARARSRPTRASLRPLPVRRRLGQPGSWPSAPRRSLCGASRARRSSAARPSAAARARWPIRVRDAPPATPSA